MTMGGVLDNPDQLVDNANGLVERPDRGVAHPDLPVENPASAVEPHRVDPDEASRLVQQRTAGRPARQWRGVLDDARDPPAARPAKAPGGR